MGIRLIGADAFSFKLEKVATRTTRALRRVHEQAANKMGEVASEMAPYDTGALEGDIGVLKVTETNRRVTRYVGHISPPKYAKYMHESVYKLGPGSLAKQQGTTHRVGRKYIERAARYIVNEWGLYEKSRKAIRENHK